jgi:exo-1,4-beta-D-glucosaminidase
VMYSYDDRSVAVINSTYQPGSNLSVTAKLFDSTLHERFSVIVPVDVAADGVTKAGAFPEHAFTPPSPVYFVDLVLKDQFGKVVSTNFYWLSAKKNVYDWSAADNDAFTPVKSYEDLTALNSLPATAEFSVMANIEKTDEGPLVRVTLQNTSDRLAFQTRMSIHRKGETSEILPVRWDDNYVTLMPGESRQVLAHFSSPNALDGEKELSIEGWNVEPWVIALPRDENGGVTASRGADRATP